MHTGKGETMHRDDRRWLAISLSALILVLASTLGLLRAFGLLDGSNNEVTAALTFAGVMITAAISLIGYLISRQSERRLIQQQSDERERLRLDAAMRAGELFDKNGEDVPSPATIASGLLALTQLQRADLAVALLVDLWRPEAPDGCGVSTEVAILVLNSALSSSDGNTELVAAELLCRHSHTLDACEALQWPSSIDGKWNRDFGLKTKILILDALVTMTTNESRHPANEDALRSITLRMYGIWKNDPNERARGCVGTLIRAVLPTVQDLGYDDFLVDPDQLVTVADIKTAADSASGNPDGFLERRLIDRANTLALWSAKCGGCFRPDLVAAVH